VRGRGRRGRGWCIYRNVLICIVEVEGAEHATSLLSLTTRSVVGRSSQNLPKLLTERQYLMTLNVLTWIGCIEVFLQWDVLRFECCVSLNIASPSKTLADFDYSYLLGIISWWYTPNFLHYFESNSQWFSPTKKFNVRMWQLRS